MMLYDFMCKTEDCPCKDKRMARAYPSPRERELYPMICDGCKKEMTEVPKKEREFAPGRIVIRGDTTTNPNQGFARGLTSTSPEDLKRDLERGDFFN